MSNKKPVSATPLFVQPTVLDLLEEVEQMPEPKESKWNIDTVVSAFLSLMKLSRTAGEKAWYGRKGFTVPELVRQVEGKDVSAYDLQTATEEINELLGFSLVDDPSDLRTNNPNSVEKPRQIPGAPYQEGSLMDLGLVSYTPKGGNRGRGYAFTLSLEAVRDHFTGASSK